MTELPLCKHTEMTWESMPTGTSMWPWVFYLPTPLYHSNPHNLMGGGWGVKKATCGQHLAHLSHWKHFTHMPYTQTVVTVTLSTLTLSWIGREKTRLSANRTSILVLPLGFSWAAAWAQQTTEKKHMFCSPVFLMSVLEEIGPQGCNRQEFSLLKESGISEDANRLCFL